MVARRAYQVIAFIGYFVVGSGAALAQQFPSKPVTLIVPWPAGGAADIELRALAAVAQNHLGQRIVIENRPGVTGTLAPLQMAKKDKPDGYVISQIPATMFWMPAAQSQGINPERDFTFIIRIAKYTGGIVVRADAPWKSLSDLIAYAHENPGKLTFATSGTDGTPHRTMERIAQAAGISWTHVPYRGTPESVAAVLGGHVDITADGSAWAPEVDAGQLRLLATWGDARSVRWPNVPTVRESGVDVVASSQYGLAGPKGMDNAVVKILHDAFKQGLETPAHIAVLRGLGQEPAYLNSSDYRAFIVREMEERRSLGR